MHAPFNSISYTPGRAFLSVLILLTLAIPSALNAQAVQTPVSGNPGAPGADQPGTGQPGNGGPVDTPTPQVTPGQLSREGIFGCNSSVYSNVGTLSAVGGVYVPVNDAAVTINTGYLVWKECVLDGTSRRIAEGGSAAMSAQSQRGYNTGRGGKPQFVQKIEREELGPDYDRIILYRIQDPNIAMCQPYRTTVQRAVARQAYSATRQPTERLRCPFNGSAAEQQAFLDSRDFSYDDWFATIDPSGHPIAAYQGLVAYTDEGINDYRDFIRQTWQWGNGTWSRFDDAENPLARNILTPGYMISQSIQQMVGSGFEQLQNANEIDQVVSALWGGLTTQIVTDSRGLIGLTQSLNGRPSYIDQMTAETSAGIRNQAVNAALAILSGALQAETTFFNAKEAVANALSEAIKKLRAAENQCWNIIIPAVQARAQQQTCTTDPNTGAQTCSGGNVQLQIATSTTASQTIIEGQIQPLATTTVNDLRTSETALRILNELAQSVANSASVTNQRAALERLDTLVANRQLHGPQDAQNAITQRDNILNALNVLVEDTITAWSESSDPNTGWCNVNNPDVVERWFNAWRI